MSFNHCAIVILSSFLVNCGIPLSVSEQDKADLNEYAEEVGKLFVELPLLNKTSGEILYQENETFIENTLIPHDEILYSDDSGSSSEVTISGGVDERLESSHDAASFSIDKGIDSSTTRGVSQRCLFERRHITEMFKECIYIQAKLTAEASNVTEPSTRDYDARFLKYCRKAPQIRRCVKDKIVSKLEHCLDEGVRETVNNVEEITERIIKFICINEADRIAMFISDGGLDCLFSSNWRMHLCLSVHLGSYVLLSLFELPSINLENVKCINLQSAQRCVAQELEMCEDPTLAVVAKLMFHIAMEIASCQEFTDEMSTMYTTSKAPKLSNVQTFIEGEVEIEMNKRMNLEVTEVTSPVTPNRGHAEQLSTVSPKVKTSSVVPGQGLNRYTSVGPNLSAILGGSSGEGHARQHSTFRPPQLRASSVASDQGRHQQSTFRPQLGASSLASGEGHVRQNSTFRPQLGASSLASGEGHVRQNSTFRPQLGASSVATGKDHPSTRGPDLAATSKSPKRAINTTISSKNKSSATKGSLICALLVLLVIIIVI